jgi:cell division control protein 6
MIPLTAAIAAQEHGDARKAIEILRHAGELAERENVETVTEEHVRDAQEWAQIDRFEELLRGSTTQVKFILYSLALLSEENPNTEGFSTSRIFDRYKETAEKIDATIFSEHRVYELLNDSSIQSVPGCVVRYACSWYSRYSISSVKSSMYVASNSVW